MADFRRSLTALAVFALLLSLAATASAQVAPGAFQCNASAAVPPQLRSEGLTELVGDIVLNCTGGIPTLNTANIPQANITVFLNTTITSRLLGGSSSATEALLLIDEPNTSTNASPLTPCLATGNSTAGCTFLGTSPASGTVGTEPYSGAAVVGVGTTSRANVFQGTLTGSNSVTFLGVPIDPPGTNGSRVIRITNIRANASAIATGAANVPGAVQASIAISGSTSIPINNPVQTVGFALSGLATAVRKPGSTDAATSSTILKQQCSDLSKNTNLAVLEFAENFATAFKIRNVGNTGTGNAVSSDTSPAVPTSLPQDKPGTIYNAESGFYSPTIQAGGTLATAGLADFGTRLKAVFNNVPAGVTIYVSTANINQTPTQLARLVGDQNGLFFQVPSTTTVTGFTGAACVGAVACGTQVTALSVVNGSATAVWEVLAADPLSIQTMQFGLNFAYTASPGTNVPAAGTSTVNLSFAPTPPSFSATDGAKAQGPSFSVPRFVDLSTAKNALNIVICRTNLLFPFTPNVAGFDTGIEISNTSADPFGTTPQAGTCTLNWFGATANGGPAPPATPVASIAAGSTYANLVSTLAPGLNGYMIAVCNFQYAHGFAYIYNNTLGQAQGYLALIIPDPPRSAGVIAAGGEQLVQ